MEFGLLGPLTVGVGGSPVTVSAGKQRVLLAALLLRANQVVPAVDLAEAVWDGCPPGSARVTLQNYVKRLRQALGPAGYERIVTRPAGYLAEVRPGELDVARFAGLREAASVAAREGAWETVSARLGTALRLWRGEPLADVPSRVLAVAEAPRLAEMRLEAVEGRVSADLHLGRHRELVGELQALTAAEPLRERLYELLMVALYRAGQQAAALAVYRQARRRLVEEVGIEPGPGLRELNQRILRSDPALVIPAAEASGGDRPLSLTARPRQPAPLPPGEDAVRPDLLPAGVPGFAGRVREIGLLSGLAASGVGVVAIGGSAGVGKTALAVHWARRVAADYPDGQLYVNLRGFGPSEPLPAGEALRGLLDDWQVPPGQIPAGVAGRQALFRSLLAGRRVLVVLDNARDAAQVRPLLPGTAGSLVLVTSRAELASLAVADGATQLSLDVLTRGEARQMLAARLGAGRVAAEPQAAGELIRLCAALPLALAITAARAVAHPRFTLAALAAELADARGRLDALSTGEEATDVRAVLSWSYQNLAPATARLFRLLGLHPGPDISAAAAASLAGQPLPVTRAQLRELTRCHLLAEPAPGRYAFHDLLRAYAAEHAATTDTPATGHAATARMLDHYLHTAHAAAMLINNARGSLDLRPAEPGTTPERLADHAEAMAWFTAEQEVLLAVGSRAAESGFDVHAWQLPWTLADYLPWQGEWQELVEISRAALAAAGRLGDAAAQARVLRTLGQACFGLRAWDDARTHLSRALGLYVALGDVVGQGRVHISLGKAMERLGRCDEALRHARQALALHEQVGNRPGQARALNNVGWYHALLGDHHQALVASRQALSLQRELGDRCGEASTWDTLGYSHHHLGHHAKATSCYQQASSIFAEIGNRGGQAETLVNLGDRHSAAGNRQAALAVWRQALRILDDMRHPDAGQVREKVSRAAAPATPQSVG